MRKMHENNKTFRKNLRNSLFFPAALFALLFILFSFLNLHSGQTDPFYRNLFLEGEKAFFARNYESAAKDLEVAVFGLGKERKLLTKSYVYLGLSYYHLEKVEKSREFLLKAVKAAGDGGFRSLGLAPQVEEEFQKLLSAFSIKEEKAAEEPTPIITLKKASSALPEKETGKKPPLSLAGEKRPGKRALSQREETAASAAELEQKILIEPHNISLYYKLYNIYREERKVGAAINVLRRLVSNNPHELNAFYILGKIRFSQKSFREALADFNKVIKPSDESQVDNELLIRSLIYITICLFRLKERENLLSFVELVEDSVSSEQLHTFLKEEGLEMQWARVKKALR